MKHKTKRPQRAAVAAPATSTKALRTGDSFQNFEARLGYGAGSIADGGTYNIDYLSRNRQQLDSMYRSSWICGKAVDCVAEDMTKRGIEIHSEAEPGEIEDLQAHWKTLKIWERLSDSLKWARLYGGCIAVVLIDGQNFATPLRLDTIRKDQFKGLLVLDRWQAQPSSELVSELGPDLGMPAYYTLANTKGGAKLAQQKIHYSRVLRFEGCDLPFFQRIAEQGWGQSVLERLFDRLLAFDSTTQGSAQLVYKAHLRTYKIKGFRDAIGMGGKALEGIVKQLDFVRRTQTNEGMTLMDMEDEFEAHQYNFGGLDAVLLQFSQQLSGALGIPLTKLFGQSPAGLNSTGESDITNYYDSIEQDQERRLRAGIDLLIKITWRSLFGVEEPEDTNFTFRPLWQLSDTEKATIATASTSAVTSAHTSGLIGRQTALKELKAQSRITGLFSNITDEMIESADDDIDTGEMAAGDPFGKPGTEDDEAAGDGPVKRGKKAA